MKKTGGKGENDKFAKCIVIDNVFARVYAHIVSLRYFDVYR